MFEFIFLDLPGLLPGMVQAPEFADMYITNATSSADVVAQRNARFHADHAAGKFDIYLLPNEGLLLVIFALYLMVDHRKSKFLQYAAYPTFGLITYLAVDVMQRCKTLGMGAGYGIGIANAWFIIWAATFMIFSDGQKMARIEKRVGNAAHVQHQLDPKSLLSPSTGVGVTSEKDWAKKQHQPMGMGTSGKLVPKSSVRFIWQPLPVGFFHRLDWVVDLITTFRGDGWSWKFTGLSRLPDDVNAQLKESAVQYMPASRGEPFKDIQSNYICLKANLISFARSYIMLDILHVLMMSDPYFWGMVSPEMPPPSFLPSFIANNWMLLRWYRTLLPLWVLALNLTTMFCGSPLFFLGFLAHVLPWVTQAQIDEPWLYSPIFRSFHRSIFEHGLGGFWARCWHSMFRHGFSAPTTWAIKKFRLNPKSEPVKLLQLVVAFVLSGFIHFCASCTQYSPFMETIPWGPFWFFSLQPLGIMIQMYASNYLNKRYKFPKWVKQSANFIYTWLWFMSVAPIHFDDFTRGGLWLIEPIPISPIRLLGFGDPKDAAVWRWDEFKLVPWRGETLWKTGIEWRLW